MHPKHIFTFYRRLSNRVALAFAPVFVAAIQLTAAANPCTQSLIAHYEPGRIVVDGTVVTGTEWSEIRELLDLNDLDIQRLYDSGAKVLSVGEGFSELLPGLLRANIDAEAIDLWYHAPEFEQWSLTTIGMRMSQFQRRYGHRLIAGNAMNLPILNETYDLVLSARLFNNIHVAETIRAIAESIRVLKVRGEARLLLSRQRRALDFNELEFVNEIKRFADRVLKNVTITESFGLLKILKTGVTGIVHEHDYPFQLGVDYPNRSIGNRQVREKEDAKDPSLSLTREALNFQMSAPK